MFWIRGDRICLYFIYPSQDMTWERPEWIWWTIYLYVYELIFKIDSCTTDKFMFDNHFLAITWLMEVLNAAALKVGTIFVRDIFTAVCEDIICQVDSFPKYTELATSLLENSIFEAINNNGWIVSTHKSVTVKSPTTIYWIQVGMWCFKVYYHSRCF